MMHHLVSDSTLTNLAQRWYHGLLLEDSCLAIPYTLTHDVKFQVAFLSDERANQDLGADELAPDPYSAHGGSPGEPQYERSS